MKGECLFSSGHDGVFAVLVVDLLGLVALIEMLACGEAVFAEALLPSANGAVSYAQAAFPCSGSLQAAVIVLELADGLVDLFCSGLKAGNEVNLAADLGVQAVAGNAAAVPVEVAVLEVVASSET